MDPAVIVPPKGPGIMKIEFSDKDIEKCHKFATSIDTRFYASRAQFNNEKRIKDQIVGKLSELVAYRFLDSKGIKTSEPDFKIYEKKDKSWDFDMKSKEYNFHVKGQNIEQGRRYGVSWIFQDGDKHIFKEYSDKDYVCFVSIDLEKKIGEIRGVVSIPELHKRKLFKMPKLEYLKTKRAVYMADLSICKKSII